ncbi:GNAT family N-acetyltransferase [Streptomyces sp. PTM05]|uniref:GNAT family N-acetyltransferase n=1 Tax=Streptantibioticus parmotrematis TaxID=2873249 RepID=A0ABS7QJB0_9ACTN|nr:GNAT family N-acetyltransferase [Streptantibioticus parmotrematis]MBY8883251.1 GNAT family N-acetyltransferase [Streptantibioticus parmotrematis]
MTRFPHSTTTGRRRIRHAAHHWRREAVELAAVFTAVAAADLAANLMAHGPGGPALLTVSAVLLLSVAGFHTWWARRHGHSPPPADPPGDTGTALPGAAEPGMPAATDTGLPAAAAHDEAAAAHDEPDAVREVLGGTTLWRLRTTVRDTPGSLARLCGALAHRHVDILTLQTHPLSDGTVDEFLIRVPAAVPAQEITRAVGAAGGRETWLERADAHDLVDTPTRVLTLATRTALDAAELPLALRQLLGRCTIRSLPAEAGKVPPTEGELTPFSLRLRDPSGGTVVVERPYLPFTPTEFARARALVELDSRLGPRMPRRREVLTLPEGNEITVRRAGPGDLVAARAMHDRCSSTTLNRRYHGPVGDAERYLAHLLSPRHGRTLAVETASGRLVALGHLLWDGDETEVALLVEDEWQGRGIGAELLRRLVALAREGGAGAVYAVTKAANTPMVAAMRGLGLALDFQVEDGTLVITATLRGQGASVPVLPGEHAAREH